jgi:hypothetical protein
MTVLKFSDWLKSQNGNSIQTDNKKSGILTFDDWAKSKIEDPTTTPKELVSLKRLGVDISNNNVSEPSAQLKSNTNLFQTQENKPKQSLIEKYILGPAIKNTENFIDSYKNTIKKKQEETTRFYKDVLGLGKLAESVGNAELAIPVSKDKKVAIMTQKGFFGSGELKPGEEETPLKIKEFFQPESWKGGRVGRAVSSDVSSVLNAMFMRGLMSGQIPFRLPIGASPQDIAKNAVSFGTLWTAINTALKKMSGEEITPRNTAETFATSAFLGALSTRPTPLNGVPTTELAFARNRLKKYGFELKDYESPEILRSKFADVVKRLHPDKGGNPDEFKSFMEDFRKVTSAEPPSGILTSFDNLKNWIKNLWKKQPETKPGDGAIVKVNQPQTNVREQTTLPPEFNPQSEISRVVQNKIEQARANLPSGTGSGLEGTPLGNLEGQQVTQPNQTQMGQQTPIQTTTQQTAGVDIAKDLPQIAQQYPKEFKYAQKIIKQGVGTNGFIRDTLLEQYNNIMDEVSKTWGVPKIPVVISTEPLSRGGGKASLVTAKVSNGGKEAKETPRKIIVYDNGLGDIESFSHELAHYIELQNGRGLGHTSSHDNLTSDIAQWLIANKTKYPLTDKETLSKIYQTARNFNQPPTKPTEVSIPKELKNEPDKSFYGNVEQVTSKDLADIKAPTESFQYTKKDVDAILDEVRGALFVEDVDAAKALYEVIPKELRPPFEDLVEEVSNAQDEFLNEQNELLNEARKAVGEEKWASHLVNPGSAKELKVINKFKSFLRRNADVRSKKTGELYREHIPASKFGISSDEVASALGMTENEFMQMLMEEISSTPPKFRARREKKTPVVSVSSSNFAQRPTFITDKGFDYSYQSAAVVNVDSGDVRQVKASEYRKATSPENARVLVIGHAREVPIFKISYDENKFLRESGKLSEIDWRNIGSKVANALINKGVDPDSTVSYDKGDFVGTLRELSNLSTNPVNFKTGQNDQFITTTGGRAGDPPPTGKPELDELQKEILKEAENRYVPEMYIGKEVRPNTFVYNNIYSKKAYQLWDGIVQLISNAPIIKKITPQEGRPEVAFRLLKEKVRIADGMYQRAQEDYIKPLRKLSSEESEKLIEMLSGYIPVTEKYRGRVIDIGAEISKYSLAIGREFQYQVEQGYISPQDAKWSVDLAKTTVGRYTRSFYINGIDKEGKPIISQPAGFSPNRLSTSIFKKKLTLEEWGLEALSHDGQVEDRNVEALGFPEKITKQLKGKYTITDLASIDEQTLLKNLSVPKVKIKVTIDEVLRKQLNNLIDSLGVERGRVLSLRGKKLGHYLGGENKIETIIGDDEKVLSHEAGHAIDYSYDLKKLFFENENYRQRVSIKHELRAVSDLRYSKAETILGESPTPSYKKYVRKRGEQVAEFVSLYVTDRELAKQLAPTAVDVFENFILSQEKLKPLIEMKSTRTLGTEIYLASPTNIAKKIIKNAKKLVDSGSVIKVSDEDLKEIGLAAKKEAGWVTQADAVLDRTLKSLIHNYTTLVYLRNIRENPELFSKEEKEGFIPVSDIVSKGYNKDLGPLKGGWVHPGLEQDLTAMVKYGKDTWINNFFGEIISWWKISKTSLSLDTGIRNWISGHYIQTYMAGFPVWHPENTHVYVGSVKDYITKGQRYKFWRDRGLYGSDYFNVEINTKEMESVEKASNPMKKFGEIVEKKLGLNNREITRQNIKESVIIQYYGQIDHIARTYLAECAIRNGLTPEQAIEFANKWELNYKIVPLIIDAFRKGVGGVISPFISFLYLMIPRVLEVLVTRPWVYLTIFLALKAVREFGKVMLNMTDNQYEANMPEWVQKNKQTATVLPVLDSNGNPIYMSFAYILPFSLPDPEKPLTWTFIDFNQAQNLFTGGQPFLQVYQNIVNNYDPFTAKKIYDGDYDPDKAKKILEYMAKQLGPGSITAAERIAKAFSGEKTGYPIKQPPSKGVAIARSLGMPAYSGGENVVLGKIRSKEKEIDDITFKIKQVMSSNDTIEEKKRKISFLVEQRNKKRQEIVQLRTGLYFSNQASLNDDVPDILKKVIQNTFTFRKKEDNPLKNILPFEKFSTQR